VTSAAELLLAAARDLGVLDLVLMGDSALRLGHCTIGELAEAATQRRRGAPMLRRVIGMLDNGVNHPGNPSCGYCIEPRRSRSNRSTKSSTNGAASSPAAITDRAAPC
jgi:hypothetical protein